MTFRFKTFNVYREAKDYAKFCRKGIFKIKEKGLADQIQRASNSIVLNIAEGSAAQSDTEFPRFLGISIRSVYETVAGFDLAKEYGLIDGLENEEIEKLALNLVKQLSAFRTTLTKRN